MNTTIPFGDFGLSPLLIESLNNIGLEKASPIQELTIPKILGGEDIFAQAETGSGKTGSFAIPIIEQMLREEKADSEKSEEETEKNEDDFGAKYIVLSPTRELAQQTHKVFNQITSNLDIDAVCLIGGENIDKQKESLQKNPEVLVATPGRLCDLVKQKCVALKECRAIVFDEADRLFDMGFKKDIEFVLGKVNFKRQLIMVSATSNIDVLKTAYKFKSNPVELKITEDGDVVESIDQELAMVSSKEKMPLLINILKENSEDLYGIVFCNTQYQTHLVAEWLISMGHKAKPISGRLPQNKRTRLMEEFRSKKVTILVCTDVAARGLDIEDVNLVVNFDLPQEAANYIHRVGRTGRAGKSGKAISFCAPEDCENLDGIYDLLGAKIPKMNLTNEIFEVKLTPKPRIDKKTLQVMSKGDFDSKRNKNMDSKSKKTSNKPAPKLAPVEIPANKPYVASQAEKKNRRVFEYTCESIEQVKEYALGYFKVNDSSLLNVEVKKLGRKKFFFFGPRKSTYEVTLKPVYKKLLTPHLINIIRLARLRLYVRVFFDDPCIKINFSGEDEGLLKRNDNELLKAFESLSRLYLFSKISLPKNVRFQVRSTSGNKKEKDLIDLAEKMKKKVLSSKESILLRPMNPSERRIIHQQLSSDKRVKTSSQGDGSMKRVEISLS